MVEEATAAAAAVAADADAEADKGSRRTVTAPRAGERSIVVIVVVAVVDVVIVVVEDDLLGAPPSCPRIRSRTLGKHQILFSCHGTPGQPITPGRCRSRTPRTIIYARKDASARLCPRPRDFSSGVTLPSTRRTECSFPEVAPRVAPCDLQWIRAVSASGWRTVTVQSFFWSSMDLCKG